MIAETIQDITNLNNEIMIMIDLMVRQQTPEMPLLFWAMHWVTHIAEATDIETPDITEAMDITGVAIGAAGAIVVVAIKIEATAAAPTGGHIDNGYYRNTPRGA